MAHLEKYKAAQDAVRRKEQRSMELNNEIADKEGDLVELDSAIEDKRFELQDLGEQVEQETRRLESVRRRITEKELEPAPQTLGESVRTLCSIDPFLAYVSRTGDSGIVCAGSFYDPRAGGIRTPNPEP
jgi:hypothetical protein